MIRSARCKRPFRAYYVYSKLQAAPKRPKTCEMWSERGFTLMPSFHFETLRELSRRASLPSIPVEGIPPRGSTVKEPSVRRRLERCSYDGYQGTRIRRDRTGIAVLGEIKSDKTDGVLHRRGFPWHSGSELCSGGVAHERSQSLRTRNHSGGRSGRRPGLVLRMEEPTCAAEFSLTAAGRRPE